MQYLPYFYQSTITPYIQLACKPYASLVSTEIIVHASEDLMQRIAKNDNFWKANGLGTDSRCHTKATTQLHVHAPQLNPHCKVKRCVCFVDGRSVRTAGRDVKFASIMNLH